MTLIEEIETEFGTIVISKNPETGALLYDVGGCHQSSSDSQGISVASYIHAIYGLLIQAKSRNVLLIGCGGGTLGTMLAGAQRQATIVDENPVSFAVARRHFALPDSVICHAAEGEAFLRGAGTYDAIVLDAFHSETIPPHLLSAEFFRLVREHLAPDGVMFANIRPKHDFDDCADQLAKSMKSAWPTVRVLDTMGICWRNAIVMAGRVMHLREPKLLVRPEMNADVIDAELRRMQFRAWKASRWDFGG